jgi:hypothetical protein
MLGDLAALVPDILGDRREIEVPGHRVIVEANHRHIGGHLEPHALQRPKGAEGHLVRFCEDGGGQIAATK